ncbi:hypothetical protein V8G54_019477 [Vigna mungo]|uniref:MULE transposase domain-containing protein n=1 Tax=Vigna mungo TaxID=3915 RepID=A0AAQ3NAY3_VIGMU
MHRTLMAFRPPRKSEVSGNIALYWKACSRSIAFWWSFSKHCILVVVLEALQCTGKLVLALCIKGLRYVGGEEHVIVGVDPDRWSYFEAVEIIKEQFKYGADSKVWWKGSREIMMNNVRLLSDDKDSMNLAKYAEETEDMVEIYVQHVPSEAVEVLFLTCGEETHDGNMEGVAEIVEEGGMSVQQGHSGEEHIEVQIGEQEVGNGEEEAEIGEEEAEIGEEEVDRGEEEAEIGEEKVEEETWRNVVEGEVEASAEQFVDQSEEERMDNDDDGFGVENDRVDDVGRNINPVLERWNSMKKRKKRVTRRENVGKVIDDIKKSFSMTVNQIIDDIKKSFSVGITAWKAGKAKQIALDSLVGDGERQYARLYDYVGEYLRVKCGTFKIKGNQPQPSLPPRFGSFYMCLDGCKQGFLGSCKPFIGVNGFHLKTTYGGQLLVAVGRDPNDQYFPLAFVVVENECKETWRWFLSQLLDDIGGTKFQRWVFISDQQKGQMTVFDELMDGVEHRLCLRHLYNNFKKRFGGGVLIRDLMMGAAKATYEKEWEKKIGELKAINIDAYNWLLGIPTKSWCKNAFSTYCRCDVLINNLTESFNSTILLARDKPIITMMEWIRTYIMKRFATLREKAMTYPGVVMPRPRKRLDKEIEKSGNWILTWAEAEKFELGFNRNTCRNAIAAINYKVQNPEDYVHVYYKKPAYATCYAPEIPKKLRRREADEPVSHTKLSKKHAIMKCSRCKEFGHNNTRGTASVGASGSRPRSEAEAPPSTSQGVAGRAPSTAHTKPSFSGAAAASSNQGVGRTPSGLGAHHLGFQASTT